MDTWQYMTTVVCIIVSFLPPLNSIAFSEDSFVELNIYTCMNAQRVKVLHVADGNAVICHVPHNFIFHLLPAQ